MQISSQTGHEADLIMSLINESIECALEKSKRDMIDKNSEQVRSKDTALW